MLQIAGHDPFTKLKPGEHAEQLLLDKQYIHPVILHVTFVFIKAHPPPLFINAYPGAHISQ